jgi:type IV pilus assembly protein PilN
MAKINLLPWREELRKKRQQDFVNALAASVVLTCVLFGLVYNYIERLKDYQTSRNNHLTEVIAAVDKQIAEIKEIEDKKHKLSAKISLIEDKQASRPKIVRVFDELRRRTPTEIYLTSFSQKGLDLSVDGKAQSNAVVANYMTEINNSAILTDPVLKVIRGDAGTDKKRHESEFTLFFKQKEDKPKENQTTDAEKKS